MDAKLIFDFLRRVASNNNRAWFAGHKAEYEAARSEFERGVAQILEYIAGFDDETGNLRVKDCTYRFYRDTRFSPDKSPYKNHFGAYINARGKKALRGGYYIHLEPGQSLVAVGGYYLPTNILTACRNEIMANEEEWIRRVEAPEFMRLFGGDESATWESQQGFGLSRLKTSPSGFPRDYAYMKYLRMKDFCCWHRVDDSFWEGDSWIEAVTYMFRTAKPMMDFMNSVIDDYE